MRFRDPGYTPAFRDVASLLERVEQAEDDDEAELAARAVLRVDPMHKDRVAAASVERARGAARPGRGRLTRLVGRMGDAPAARAWIVEALGDADPKTRRAAARAAAKIAPGAELEGAVLAAWDRGDADDRRALAAAVAAIGGEEAKRRLATTDDPKAVRASLILERSEARARPAAIAVDAARAEPTRVRFHARAGLEAIVKMELGEAWAPRIVAPGIVEARLEGPLARALAVRTATHVSLPVEGDLLSPAALDRLRTFTRGRPIRFRVAWSGGGKQRARTWKLAEEIRRATTELVNDSRESTWEAILGGEEIELVPRAYEDARFAYRRATVPASSHPTIAAAIALVAPRKDGDVVWDPFVGAGAELVERARLGRYARLIGTDVDPKAAEAARTNLAAAGIEDAVVEVADALAWADARREPVDAIVSNPPMGRRVQRGTHGDLLEAFVDRAAAVLAPGGALVWVVPEPKRIRARAKRAGLVLEGSWSLDMGGFGADLAVYRKRV